jgi:hypothetical protein
VDHGVGMRQGDRARDRHRLAQIGDVPALERDSGGWLRLETEPHDARSRGDESTRQVGTDEAAHARDEDGPARHESARYRARQKSSMSCSVCSNGITGSQPVTCVNFERSPSSTGTSLGRSRVRS